MPRLRALAAGVAGGLLLAAAGEGAAQEWQVAEGVRAWSFPRDHGSHPAFRTEWWYFTGILDAEDGRRFGYQLTFFRQGLVPAAEDTGSPWSVRDVYLAHFALADLGKGGFRFAERVSRAGPGLAGAAEEGLRVWALDWSAASEGETIVLEAREGDASLSLTLRPRRPPVLHGLGGLSRKGPERGHSVTHNGQSGRRCPGTHQGR